jgi:hypothetical protein
MSSNKKISDCSDDNKYRKATQLIQSNVFDYVIKKYMGIKALVNLADSNICNKKINDQYINSSIKGKIQSRLKPYFLKYYGAFINFMCEMNAMISGSFIIQTILDEKYKGSDLDIYIPINFPALKKYNQPSSQMREVYSKISKFILDLTELYKSKGIFKLPDYLYGYDSGRMKKMSPIYDPDYEGLDPRIVNIFNFVFTEEFKIQIIIVDTRKGHSLKTHNQLTGFDVCRNTLCFTNKKQPELCIQNIRGIVNKKIKFTVLALNDFYNRISKYSARGFYFKPDHNKNLIIEYLLYNFDHRYCIMTYKDLKHRKGKNLVMENCRPNCPIKLLYKNVQHSHFNGYVREFLVRYIIVENKLFIGDILNYFRTDDIDRRWGKDDDWADKAKNINEYIKCRIRYQQKYPRTPHSLNNSFKRMNFNPSENYKYDIRYGDPCIKNTSQHINRVLSIIASKPLGYKRTRTRKSTPPSDKLPRTTHSSEGKSAPPPDKLPSTSYSSGGKSFKDVLLNQFI